MKKTSWKKAYAYVIGLNKYQHLRTLSYCEEDAKIFAETISNVISNIKIELLDGSSFTSEKFKNVLKEISSINEKEENSVLFFFYAGHGFSHEGRDYLTSYDTSNNIDTMTNTSISTTELIDSAYKSNINTVVMIFDACRNFIIRGGIGDPFGNLTAEISRRKGIISFFSCSPGEYSQELSGAISHGIYTYSLIQVFKECKHCTPLAINNSVKEKVGKLVNENNLIDQKPYTTVGPIEKVNLDILSGNDTSYLNEKKPICILIAGSSHAGKSGIGSYLATEYKLGHYEMSAFAYHHYEKSQSNGFFNGTMDDFLEHELCAKNEDKDVLARDLLGKYDGSNNIVISGPRFVEEVETLLSYNNWNIIPLYIYTEPKIRLERFLTLQKDISLSTETTEVTYIDYVKKDMRQASWGLAKIATMNSFEMIINNDDINTFFKKVKTHTDSIITKLHLEK